MTKTKITSEVRLVSEVLSSGRFEVPWHQRYYDWKQEEVSDLLYDLKDALDTSKTCYFLGSIMLVTPTNAKPYRVNDGQQRLITLSLIIAAFCRRFARKRPYDPAREDNALRALFDRPDTEISKLADSASYTLRIKPPKIDKTKYRQIVCGHNIGANGLLTIAWNVIDAFVENINKPTREALFDFIMQKLEVSVLAIPPDVDSNSVFEALNARGKSLDDLDLIRNRIYSYFSATNDTARREAVHDNLERIAVVFRYPSWIPEYYRCFLQCRYGYLQKTRFYRESRQQIEKRSSRNNPSDHVFELVACLGLQESIELFRVIKSGRVSNSLEKLLPKISGKRKLSVLLNELKGYTVSHPLVYALLHRFIDETHGDEKRRVGRLVTRSLRNLTSFVMRTAFVAPKFESSRFEAAFANMAQTVLNGNDVDSLHILGELERHDEGNVCSDKHFIRRMAETELRDKRALRYLFGINARRQPGSGALRDSQCTVEHIFPQSESHWEDWAGFKSSDVDGENWVYRTGNLVVVSKGENRSKASFNRNFAAKKQAFKDSTVLMARRVTEEFNEWTPEVIEERSQELAREAAVIWRFDRRKAE